MLDDRRNWWRVRNFNGQIGHVPNTLLKLYEIKGNNHDMNGGFHNIDGDKVGGYF